MEQKCACGGAQASLLGLTADAAQLITKEAFGKLTLTRLKHLASTTSLPPAPYCCIAVFPKNRLNYDFHRG